MRVGIPLCQKNWSSGVPRFFYKSFEKMASADKLKSLIRSIPEIASFATQTVQLDWNALNLEIGGSCGHYKYESDGNGHEKFTIRVPRDPNAWNTIRTLVHEYGHVCVARLKTGVERLPGMRFTRDHGEFIALVFGWFAVSRRRVNLSVFGLSTGNNEQDRADAMYIAYILYDQSNIGYKGSMDEPYSNAYLTRYGSAIQQMNPAYYNLLVFVNQQHYEMLRHH